MPQGPVSLVSEGALSNLTDLVRRNWTVVKQVLPRQARQLFISEMIGQGQGSSKRIQEFDGETFASRKPEGANSSKARVGVGYEKDMEANTFSKEIEITLEMRNDNRYAQIGEMIKSLTGFCENRQDLDLTHRLTFATSTSYVDMDGDTVTTTMGDALALLSTVHTLAFSSTTYSNRITGDPAFSQTAFEAGMLLANTQTYNNFGEQRMLEWNTIITTRHPGTCRIVRQMLNSEADIDAVQSGIVNVYKNKMRHVVLPYLDTTATGVWDSTKQRWWFIAAINGLMGWQAYVGDWISPTLKTPAPGNNGEDIHNYNWTYSTFARWGIAIVSGRGIIGACPTS